MSLFLLHVLGYSDFFVWIFFTISSDFDRPERKFQGAKWPGNERARERKFQGANWPGFYWPGSELARERKGCESEKRSFIKVKEGTRQARELTPFSMQCVVTDERHLHHVQSSSNCAPWDVTCREVSQSNVHDPVSRDRSSDGHVTKTHTVSAIGTVDLCRRVIDEVVKLAVSQDGRVSQLSEIMRRIV